MNNLMTTRSSSRLSISLYPFTIGSEIWERILVVTYLARDSRSDFFPREDFPYEINFRLPGTVDPMMPQHPDVYC
jgi:hypothetical protein